MGINTNADNLVTDINGARNLAGAGINIAQRVMDSADGNQILVSHSVYDTLRDREKRTRTRTAGIYLLGPSPFCPPPSILEFGALSCSNL